MGTVMRMPVRKRPPRDDMANGRDCEIVIFPGVRIERHDVDLGARLNDAAGQVEFEVFGSGSPAGTG